MNTDVVEQRSPVAVAVDGLPDMHEIQLHTAATAAELLEAVKKIHPELGLAEVLVEDEEDVVGGEVRIVERIRLDFKAVHVTRGGHVHVTVSYDGKSHARDFRPSATVRTVIVWAISDAAFDLLDPPGKFVMKMGDLPLEPELHLGQVRAGAHHLALTLVHARKPQG